MLIILTNFHKYHLRSLKHQGISIVNPENYVFRKNQKTTSQITLYSASVVYGQNTPNFAVLYCFLYMCEESSNIDKEVV